MKHAIMKAFAFAAVAGALCAVDAPAQQAVDGGLTVDAVVDSIAANQWRLEEAPLTSWRMKSITMKLDGDLEVKEADTTWFAVTARDDSTTVFRETTADGEVLPDAEERVQHEGEGGEGEEEGEEGQDDSMSPFAPFTEEQRDRYRFRLLAPDEQGRPRIAWELKEKKDDTRGFEGEAVLDPAAWMPVQITGRIQPYPKMVREMDIRMSFEPLQGPWWVMRRVNTFAHAKVVLLHYRIRSVQEMFGHELEGQ